MLFPPVEPPVWVRGLADKVYKVYKVYRSTSGGHRLAILDFGPAGGPESSIRLNQNYK